MGIFNKHKKTPKGSNHESGTKKTINSAILHSIHDGIIIISGTGVVQYANPAAGLLANFVAEEAVGLHFLSILSLVDQNGAIAENGNNPINIALRENKFIETKAYKIAKNNVKEFVSICLTITPISADSNGDKTIIMRDITKELKDEQERSEFVSTASHEMRTPIASIEGYLGLALSPQTATIDNRARAYLEKARESSQHLGELFRDLLDTSKLDDEQAKTHPVPVEMVALVKSITDKMASDITDKGLHYNFGQHDAGSNMSSSSRKLGQVIYCSIDTDYLREIINNLINNAIKYTPASGIITVSVVGSESEAIISISDTGIGISREHQKHIFQKFYRVDNSQTRSSEGAGLGLYVVKQRVAAMNGRVWVESGEGKGTKFLVAFPRISSADYERQKMAMSSTMMSSSPYAAPSSTQEDSPAPQSTSAESSILNPAAPPDAPVLKPVTYLSANELEQRKAEFGKKMQTDETQNV